MRYNGKKFKKAIQPVLALCVLTGLLAPGYAFAEDWPAYMHDNARTGYTTEVLVLQDLEPEWTYSSPSPPQRAWSDGPPWDAWSYNGAVPMRDFDTALFVTVVGEDVYFGSSVTNSVHCIDAKNGSQKWFFRTDGAVRFPPTCSDNKLYFGSDDGYAYCITTDGDLVWKYSPAGDNARVLCNNGNLITMWPIRSGTALLDGKVYFSASLVPWKASYLCSVDAATGSDSGAGLYRVSGGSTPTGAILASNSNIYLPHGRHYPRIFSRATGAYSGEVSAAGVTGVYALLTSDGPSTGFVHGQGRTGAYGYRLATQNDKIASLDNGKYMVVSGGASYVITETFGVETTKGYRTNPQAQLKAIDRNTSGTLWTVTCDTRCYSLIGGGDILFVGGIDKVTAYDTADGGVLWTKPVNGRVRGLAAAGTCLFASTDTGKIYMFGKVVSPADLNKDGVVNLEDFARFAQEFQRCTHPDGTTCEDLSGE